MDEFADEQDLLHEYRCTGLMETKQSWAQLQDDGYMIWAPEEPRMSTSNNTSHDNPRTLVWWDTETCPAPTTDRHDNNVASWDATAHHLVQMLSLQHHSRITCIAYGTGEVPDPLLLALRSHGIAMHRRNLPTCTLPGAGTTLGMKSMIVDILFWALNNPPPAQVRIISATSEPNFSKLLRGLLKRYHLLLASSFHPSHVPNPIGDITTPSLSLNLRHLTSNPEPDHMASWEHSHVPRAAEPDQMANWEHSQVSRAINSEPDQMADSWEHSQVPRSLINPDQIADWDHSQVPRAPINPDQMADLDHLQVPRASTNPEPDQMFNWEHSQVAGASINPWPDQMADSWEHSQVPRASNYFNSETDQMFDWEHSQVVRASMEDVRGWLESFVSQEESLHGMNISTMPKHFDRLGMKLDIRLLNSSSLSRLLIENFSDLVRLKYPSRDSTFMFPVNLSPLAVEKMVGDFCELLAHLLPRRDSESPMSTVKTAFRARFGYDLDHDGAGFAKLSQFLASVPGVVRVRLSSSQGKELVICRPSGFYMKQRTCVENGTR